MGDLDEMLRRYLEREEADPIRRRLEAQADWSVEHERKDDHRHGDIIRAIDGHAFRISGLEAKAVHLEDEVENTGQHRLDSIRAKAKRWDDLLWRIIGLGVVGLLGAGVVELVHRFAGK